LEIASEKDASEEVADWGKTLSKSEANNVPLPLESFVVTSIPLFWY